MSAMRKMGVYLGLLEDADGDYVDSQNAYDEPARRSEPRSTASPLARWPTSPSVAARPP